MVLDNPTAAAEGGAPRLFALVPCAGIGERAASGVPKQYARLGEHALVTHTLRALAGVRRLSAILVVLSPQDEMFESHCADFKGWVARCGGTTRAVSVALGLDDLLRRGARAADWVIVHDAARCLIRPAWVDRLIDACLEDPVGGLLAMPVADTLKMEVNGRAAMTIDRAGKWVAQTPQMFHIGMLRDALARSGAAVTDESSAIEAAGHSARLVPGSAANIKVTWPEDMDLANRLLGSAPQLAALALPNTPKLAR